MNRSTPTPDHLKQLLEKIQALAPDEKETLLDILETDPTSKTYTIPEAQQMMVMERIRAYEKQPDKYLTWEQLEQQLQSGK
ncbi:hypothetical protein LX69_00728 [Breznakibacter xylanolyticus]|uniref:Uncharacterized protein n=1 Tax=Breznakibacter xylanolyticus TaxID=990 RepID=A0A2W7NGC7_9BACT|nr:hypothetical protein [Breznakibacter xylanolyticus]MBN2742943.1 hypothetical protein [Marinilabiliaceae bacterium]PZX19461.1 hypothetical protein LX69_00728 [Breznakibacter xylanolyticus]